MNTWRKFEIQEFVTDLEVVSSLDPVQAIFELPIGVPEAGCEAGTQMKLLATSTETAPVGRYCAC